jgi:DNA-binding MarR family transcriptional regulator
MSDSVDEILRQWREQRPDLDTSDMGPVGRLSRVAAAIAARQRTTFAKHDMDASAFDVLATLRRNRAPHKLTPSQLAASSMITTSATAQRLNRLEEQGLVRRLRRADDARGIEVELTDAGKQLVDETLPAHLQTERDVMSGLTVEQQATLSHLLGLMLVDLEQRSTQSER